jgi:hypothetical protein
MVTQVRSKGMLFVAVAVVVAAVFVARQRPTNGIGERGHVIARRRRGDIPLCLCVVMLNGCGSIQDVQKGDVCNVKCKLSSGGACLMYVERGPRQAVCQPANSGRQASSRVV